MGSILPGLGQMWPNFCSGVCPSLQMSSLAAPAWPTRPGHSVQRSGMVAVSHAPPPLLLALVIPNFLSHDFCLCLLLSLASLPAAASPCHLQSNLLH